VEALHSLLDRAGLKDIAVRPVEIQVTSIDFNDYWTSQTPAFTPNGKVVAGLSDTDRARLIDAVRAILVARVASAIRRAPTPGRHASPDFARINISASLFLNA
jgi:hypothetical protein